MGMVYAEVIMGIAQPRVGLLSNGEEDSKGNQAVKAAHKLLRGSGLPFIGNVEARDVFAGKADVVVCDGFVGNVLLKTAEGVASMVAHFIEDEVRAHPLLKVPIAMLMGGYMRYVRVGKVLEASVLGVIGLLLAVWGGKLVYESSSWSAAFTLGAEPLAWTR